MSRGLGRTAGPLADIAAAVRGYAGVLRTAQQRTAAYDAAVQRAQASGGDTASLQAAYAAQADATAASAQLHNAGQQAAAQVHASAAALDDVFAPEGVLRGTIEEIHTALGAAGADGVLWALGRGAEQAKQFLDKLPEMEQQWLHDVVPWGLLAANWSSPGFSQPLWVAPTRHPRRLRAALQDVPLPPGVAGDPLRDPFAETQLDPDVLGWKS